MDLSFSSKTKRVETFTPRAIKVLGVAGHEAESRGHALINDLHLLLGLFGVGDTAASIVLNRFAVDPDKLRTKLASDLKPGQQPGRGIPFDPICREILESASAEAARLNHRFVGTEHLLLGILKAGGPATHWLQANGVKPNEMINYILQEIPPGLVDPSPARETPGFFGRILNLFSRQAPTHLPLPEAIYDSIGVCFTPRVRQVLHLARQEARLRNHRLDDIHLLYGLCQFGQGVAVQVLRGIGGDWDKIRERTITVLDQLPHEPGTAELPAGDRLKTVFSLAQRELKILHHHYLGTEHLFLGLLQASGPAAEAICYREFTVHAVKAAILQALDPNFSEGPAVLSDEATTDEPIPAQGNVFTPRVIKALEAAQTESREQGVASVGALQLLAGLLTLGDGVAVNVLQRRGVTLERVQTAIKQVCAPGEPVKTSVNIPYTVAAHDILASAHQEALKMDHTFTGAEHLLLAILQSDSTSLSDFFKAAGVDREALIEIVLDELNGSAE